MNLNSRRRDGDDPAHVANSARQLDPKTDQHPAWWEAHHKLTGSIVDLNAVLRKMAPQVLNVQTFTLDASGSATAQYRVQYQSLTVDSQSTKLLTIANMPLQAPPGPGAGPGIYVVKAGGFAVVNFTGYVWSIYGGTANEVVTVTAYGNPQPPATR